jgi:hypothetical protein
MTLTGARRWGPGGPVYFADFRPGDFSGPITETEMEEG